MLKMKNYLFEVYATRIKEMLHILVPILLCIVGIKLYLMVLIVSEAHCKLAKGLLATTFDANHDAVREGLFNYSMNFQQELNHLIEKDHIDHRLFIQFIVIIEIPFEILSCLTEVNSFKIKALRSLVEPGKEWMTTDLRVLLLAGLEVFLCDLPELLIYHLCIFLVAYPVAQRPPCFIHPQLTEVVLTAHVARLHLRYSVYDLKHVPDVEEVEELVGSRYNTSLKELVELECRFHAVFQRGALTSSRPIVGVRLKDLSKHRLVMFVIHCQSSKVRPMPFVPG